MSIAWFGPEWCGEEPPLPSCRLEMLAHFYSYHVPGG